MTANMIDDAQGSSITVNKPNLPELDVTIYLKILMRWWREIALFLIIVPFVVGGLLLLARILQPPTYRASSLVAIARVTTDVTFDERFRTISEAEANSTLTNASSRRTALLGLVKNGAVAESVILDLNDILSEEEKVAATLLESVSAVIVSGQNVRVEGDLIRISAESDSSEKASLIATKWAEYYVDQVNRLYGQSPPEVLAAVQIELASADGVYQSAQREFESFISTNQVRTLQRQIDEKQGLIDSLQTGKQTAIDTIVEEELTARRQIISAYINALAVNRLLGF